MRCVYRCLVQNWEGTKSLFHVFDICHINTQSIHILRYALRGREAVNGTWPMSFLVPTEVVIAMQYVAMSGYHMKYIVVGYTGMNGMYSLSNTGIMILWFAYFDG